MVSPGPDGKDIETPSAAAREMAALLEEVAALRAALTAHTSASAQITTGLRGEVAALLVALTSPDSGSPLGHLRPSEAQVQRGVSSKIPRPPTTAVQRGTPSPNSSPLLDRLPSEALVPRGVPSEADSSPPLDSTANLIEPTAFDIFTEGTADFESTSELLILAEEHAEVAVRRCCVWWAGLD